MTATRRIIRQSDSILVLVSVYGVLGVLLVSLFSVSASISHLIPHILASLDTVGVGALKYTVQTFSVFTFYAL